MAYVPHISSVLHCVVKTFKLNARTLLSMAPLSLIEIAETIAEAQKNYAASNMKSADGAYMMGTTAFFLSLSGSFAIHIALRSKLPARLRHSAIPIGFACAVALSVPKYLKHGPTTSKHVEDALHTVSPTTLW